MIKSNKVYIILVLEGIGIIWNYFTLYAKQWETGQFDIVTLFNYELIIEIG